MPRFQLKITLHTKNQKNSNMNEKRQSTDNIKMVQTLELSKKDFCSHNKNVSMSNTNMLETNFTKK